MKKYYCFLLVLVFFLNFISASTTIFDNPEDVFIIIKPQVIGNVGESVGEVVEEEVAIIGKIIDIKDKVVEIKDDITDKINEEITIDDKNYLIWEIILFCFVLLIIIICLIFFTKKGDCKKEKINIDINASLSKLLSRLGVSS